MRWTTIAKLSLAVTTMALTTLPLVAQATTKPYQYPYHPTTITINNHQVGTPSAIMAADSFSPNKASIAYIPIYSFEQTLSDAGVLVDWNKNILNLEVPYPLHFPSSPKVMPVSSHTMLIEENHHPILYAPEIQYPMEGSKVNTAYVPVPYLDTVLNTFAKSVTWDGTHWTMNTVFPDGWVPPILTTKWSPALAANHEQGEFNVFAKELGFSNGGNVYTLNAIGNAIIIGYDTDGGNDLKQKVEVSMVYGGWGPSTYEKSQGNWMISREAYRIPIVSIQLAKFYFGSDWRQFWNYQAGDTPLNKFFTFGNRQVQTIYSQGTYSTAISRPGETLYGKPLKR